MNLVTQVKGVAITTAVVVAMSATPGPTTAANDRLGVHSLEQGTGEGDRRECPGPEFSVTVRDRGGVTTQTTVRVAGAISEVPEFHDCQRFITANAPNEGYNDLFAVFAAFRLDSLAQILDTLNAHNPTKKYAVAAAEVYTAAGTYKPLGIKPGFNCMYLTNENGWKQAYMLWTGTNEEKCEMLFETTAAIPPEAKVLNVSRVVVGAFAATDYPPVARWETFPGGVYYIGIKCGNAWCRVGVQNSEAVAQAVAGPPTAEARVKHISGWFDEQRLAVLKAPPSPGLPVRPSSIRGTVRPRPNLGELNDPTQFATRWVEVGTIEIHDPPGPYQAKLGLGRGVNRLFLRGKVGDTLWQAMIVSPGNRKTYRSVSRYGHEGKNYNIPGTLRWRWLATDEGVWARCLEGCCQVQTDS